MPPKNHSKEEKKQKILKIITMTTILLVIIVILIQIIICTLYHIIYKAGLQADEYLDDFVPDTKSLNDGTYKGYYLVFGLIKGAEIEFEIKDRRVSFVTFHHILHTPDSDAPEKILSDIEKNQDLDFDAISGASRTTSFAKSALKKAIENEKNE